MKECFYSGSYETYLDPCKCEGVMAYREAKAKLKLIMDPIDLKIQIMETKEQIEKEERELESSKRHLQLLEDKEKK